MCRSRADRRSRGRFPAAGRGRRGGAAASPRGSASRARRRCIRPSRPRNRGDDDRPNGASVGDRRHDDEGRMSLLLAVSLTHPGIYWRRVAGRVEKERERETRVGQKAPVAYPKSRAYPGQKASLTRVKKPRSWGQFRHAFHDGATWRDFPAPGLRTRMNPAAARCCSERERSLRSNLISSSSDPLSVTVRCRVTHARR